ncbi:aspartate carbamoyltransferase [Sulfoacidibacillus thermotolerans]|uniref:Aspartate carbamoyltransferase n=1 Tax=Sulfoacidibacillus thermotolerans TaxID=1765684 RepID=A0A2U3D7S7_SULT2|nr:aspartate carbamoyltransferase [Sulfoacidibacillus thermotolerans]PWI57323.1 aspartate carbamoyltransferase [Sulfoacidibacillus thermotolerans]
MKHLISAKQLQKTEIMEFIDRAKHMASILKQGGTHTLDGKLMAALFFEPSTRTRLSFETAMLRLGGQVISTESAREFSSAVKGETLEDTIRVVAGYVDVIVLRHHEIGAAARAASVSTVPILSAGDGAGEHPTQALLDLYTIERELGHVDGLTVALVGDLLYGRTVHSLVYLLSQFTSVRLLCTAPASTPLPDDVRDFALAKGVSVEYEPNLERAARQADVIYQTRIQKERFSSLAEYDAVKGKYVIDEGTLLVMKEHAIIMHPLPRAGEITPGVDKDPRAAYFRQSHYGVPMRMGILQHCLER